MLGYTIPTSLLETMAHDPHLSECLRPVSSMNLVRPWPVISCMHIKSGLSSLFKRNNEKNFLVII